MEIIKHRGLDKPDIIYQFNFRGLNEINFVGYTNKYPMVGLSKAALDLCVAVFKIKYK